MLQMQNELEEYERRFKEKDEKNRREKLQRETIEREKMNPSTQHCHIISSPAIDAMLMKTSATKGLQSFKNRMEYSESTSASFTGSNSNDIGMRPDSNGLLNYHNSSKEGVMTYTQQFPTSYYNTGSTDTYAQSVDNSSNVRQSISSNSYPSYYNPVEPNERGVLSHPTQAYIVQAAVRQGDYLTHSNTYPSTHTSEKQTVLSYFPPPLGRSYDPYPNHTEMIRGTTTTGGDLDGGTSLTSVKMEGGGVPEDEHQLNNANAHQGNQKLISSDPNSLSISMSVSDQLTGRESMAMAVPATASMWNRNSDSTYVNNSNSNNSADALYMRGSYGMGAYNTSFPRGPPVYSQPLLFRTMGSGLGSIGAVDFAAAYSNQSNMHANLQYSVPTALPEHHPSISFPEIGSRVSKDYSGHHGGGSVPQDVSVSESKEEGATYVGRHPSVDSTASLSSFNFLHDISFASLSRATDRPSSSSSAMDPSSKLEGDESKQLSTNSLHGFQFSCSSLAGFNFSSASLTGYSVGLNLTQPEYDGVGGEGD